MCVSGMVMMRVTNVAASKLQCWTAHRGDREALTVTVTVAGFFHT